MVEEYITREAPDIEARKLGLMDAAKALTEKGYTLPDYVLAGLTQDQKDAFALQREGIGSFQPFLTQAQQAGTTGLGTTAQAISQLGQLGGAPTQTQLDAYMNPFQQAVIDTTMAELNKQGQLAQSQLATQAQQAGAFGGSRFGVAQAELGEGLQDARARALAQLNLQNYGQAQAGVQNQLERERALAAEELKGERLGIIQERAPKMERAAAQRAATGMAYSGPTERAIRYGQEQGLGSLADIVRRERDTEKTYTSGVAGEIERAKDAQRRFSGQGGAVQGYWKGLQDIFEGAQVAATDVAIAGEDLLNAWADFGGTRNLGGTSLTGMGVTGYSAFQEGDAGGWAPYQQFEGTEGAPQRAESFAQALIDQASAKISGLEINPDVDLSLIGQ